MSADAIIQRQRLDDAVDRLMIIVARHGINALPSERQRMLVKQTIDSLVRATREAVASPELVAQIRAALEGDSNDAEHDALAAVADEFGVQYTAE